MRGAFLALIAIGISGIVSGCHFIDRHLVDVEDGKSQVIEADSGDRYYFSLDENVTTGYSWVYTCDDRDVSVEMDHQRYDAEEAALCGASGKVAVRLRVHQGFRGPATIHFMYRRAWEKTPIREFSIVLYCRGIDTSFWH